jgi:hypothetical protein
LVAPELREKFDRQRYLYNQAIWHGRDLEEVKRESLRMVKAWLALDRMATEAGHAPAPPEVIEAVLEDGTVVGIVPDNCAASLAHGEDGRRRVIYTASEIARLLSAWPALAKVKAAFPGATVEAVRDVRDPLDAFSNSHPKLDEPFVEDGLDDFYGMGG